MPTRRKDPAAEKRLLHAAWLVGVATLGVGGSLACVSQTASGSAANQWSVVDEEASGVEIDAAVVCVWLLIRDARSALRACLVTSGATAA